MVNAQEARKIYERIKDTLEGQEGSIIAIDPESGDYFLGKNTVEAYEKGKQLYPNKEFFFMRVGAKTAFVVGAHAC